MPKQRATFTMTDGQEREFILKNDGKTLEQRTAHYLSGDPNEVVGVRNHTGDGGTFFTRGDISNLKLEPVYSSDPDY